MKLRINQNSIRLRLTQLEVKRIENGLTLTEQLNLGAISPGFAYSLVLDEIAHKVSAEFSDSQLKVTVPASLAQNWAKTDEVTIKHVQHQGEKHESIILIEKDFQCLHQRPDEDESDNFPNPKSLSDYENCE